MKDNRLLGNTDARGNTKNNAWEWLVPKSDVAHIPCVSIVYTSAMYHFPAVKGQLELQEFDDREEICGRILERAINNPPSTSDLQPISLHILIDS